MNDRVGCVVIGRNEGERLVRCLDRLLATVSRVVYVDSGSTDRSAEMARNKGVTVVDLDMSVPFTAARGRNAGLERMRVEHPSVAFVQFLDGDCEIVGGWLATAAAVLEARPDLAAVCGRLRERHPEASVYNQLCDLEWDTPVGPATACGGNAMMRVAAFVQVGGFDPSLIAGEEPELCFRLRAAGWKIERIAAEMALHDAAIDRFDQWWKRHVRSGHAYAEGAAMHGGSPERYFVRENVRIVLWGAVLPFVATAFVLPTFGASLVLLGGYPLNIARVYARTRARGVAPRVAFAYAVATALVVKFPEAIGVGKYWRGRWQGSRSRLIEYK